MLDLASEGLFSRELVVERMAHAPARLFDVDRRGFVREGYFADLVLVDPQRPTLVTPASILSKCGWSPFEGHSFGHSIAATFVNGCCAWRRGELSQERPEAHALTFNH